MTQKELTVLNLGQSLDDLANLDPRGYGVCKILYSAARKKTDKPLCMNAAQKLIETVKPGDFVYILTGFVLPPWNQAETDGAVSSVLLCRALVKGLGAKPVLVCPEECREAVQEMSACAGLHLYEDLNQLKQVPASMGMVVFTKDAQEAPKQADRLIESYKPAAVVSIECPGCNAAGVYHNATGVEVTNIEAKQDVLFEKLQSMGVLNIAIGDLGNEIGMGAIEETLNTYIPKGEIIGVRTKTDDLITATVSDWGCYAMIAAMGFLLEDPELMHTKEMEQQVLTCGAENGLVDMYGEHIPAIDGLGLNIMLPIAELMGSMVKRALELRDTCKNWFDQVEGLGYFHG